MRTIRWVLAALALVALADRPAAQAPTFADLRAAAIKAMGGRDVTRIEYSGAGWDACLGQAWKITEGWARWEVQDYRRVIDYRSATSLQTARRRAAMDPARIGGCGGQPDAAFANQQTSIGANATWPDQLPIWLTPHGFLAIASASAEATADKPQRMPIVSREGRGLKVAVAVTRAGIRYTLNGYYDRESLLERIETWIDDPVYGDMAVEARFGTYRDFNGMRYPASMVHSQGGLATLNLTVTAVVPDSEASAAPPPRPAGARGAGPGAPAAASAPTEPPFYELADGIFVFSGAYQGVAVEFDDFSVLIDGMQNDARVRDLVRLTREAIPNKPIRYAVNTHSHFDHAAGLRQLAAEGATVITHATNRAFFERVLNVPRTLTAERAPAARQVSVQGVRDRHVLRDKSGQSIELHALQAGAHAADMLIAYLPRARAVVESDLLQPWINPVFGGGRTGPHPYLVYLDRELERLQLPYERFVPIHRPNAPPTMTKADLQAAVGRAAPAPAARAEPSASSGAGIATSHIHLNVPDLAAHARIWTQLGGEERPARTGRLLTFPGASIVLTEAKPAAPSSETAFNHIGFSVRDYADYQARLKSLGATFVFDSAENGQMIVDLPDGVRLEILVERGQAAPIAFHHAHVSALDGAALRDWYVKVFGAEPGERRNLPSAVLPGGRLDFLPVKGAAPRPSRGAAIDHIAFEAQDLAAFVRRLKGVGIALEGGAFLVDPAGVAIEVVGRGTAP
jgi:glyoxylase-like metal-dependent hydrolase (beta-lactamase superfamily II)